MKIWFPIIRAGSGSDVYVERLVSGLRARGVDAHLQWFDHRYELLPGLLGGVRPPEGTQLVHANSWNGFAFKRLGIPLVVTAFHCVYRCGYPAWKTGAQAVYHDCLIGRYERRSFGQADAVVAMAPSAAEDFCTRFALPPLTTIHGWVDTDTFSPGPQFREGDGRVRILIVGNALKRKGMDLLPKLRGLLGPEFTITVVGGLRSVSHGSCPDVIYKNRLSEDALVSEYRKADLVVSLSRHEGFGYTLLEAMACGKPVVAFDVTGIRDVVSPQVSGVLVPSEDVHELARACQAIASEPARAHCMGNNGRCLALTKFDAASAISAYVTIYKDLGSRKPSPWREVLQPGLPI